MDAAVAGPFFDPVHKMYHLFYQDHVSIAQNGSNGKPLTGTHGPDWGHVVSKDFVHWTHLREAIWNTEWYDLHAIYTGSTTIVDGKPVIIYPGICDQSHVGCVSGTALAAAVPANTSDPLYQHWTKAPPGGTGADNPLVNNTQRDPSTAWRCVA